MLSQRCITPHRSSRLMVSCTGHGVQQILQDRNCSQSDSDSPPQLSITSSTHVTRNSYSHRSYCTVFPTGNIYQLTDRRDIQSTRYRTEHILCNSQKIMSTSLSSIRWALDLIPTAFAMRIFWGMDESLSSEKY